MKNYIPAAWVLTLALGFTSDLRADMNGTQPEVVPAKAPVAQPQVTDVNGVPKLEVEFAPASAVVPPSFHTGLDAFGNYLKNNPNSTASVTGYADHTGHGPANVALAQKRADTVSQYLQSHFGIASSRIVSQGYGEVSEKTQNETAASQQFNRRVIGSITTAKS